MAKVKIGKPPNGLTGEQLQAWFEDQFEDAYEKQMFDHREARRKADAAVEDVKAQMEELKKLVPDEGAVLLKGKDAEKWQELKSVDLDALRAQAAEAERVTRHAFLHEVAEATGFNPKTFAELVELRDVTIEAQEVDGRKRYVVQVPDGEKTKAVDVTEHFQTQFADWLPALAPPTGGQLRLPGPPPAGRLINQPPRGKPGDFQSEFVNKAQAEAARSRSVLAAALVPDSGGNK